jgi:hypothetical protein
MYTEVMPTTRRSFGAGSVVVPTVHLNGSSGSVLAERIKAAHGAISLAMEALAETAPNARDYYPQGDAAFAEADLEHRYRAQRLRDISVELIAIHEAISQVIVGVFSVEQQDAVRRASHQRPAT